MGPDALELRLELALALADEARLPEALEQLDRAEALALWLVHIEIQPRADLATLRDEVEDRAVSATAARVRATSEAGLQGAALGELGALQALLPHRADLGPMEAELWLAWSQQARAAGDPRLAAQRLGGAARAGDADAGRQAAGELRDLGEEARARGACRRAADDLQLAGRLLPSPEAEEELQRAERCARTWLTVDATAQAMPLGVTAQALHERLRARLARDGSRFLRLDEDQASGAALARLLPSAGGPVKAGPASTTLRVLDTGTTWGVATPIRRSERFLAASGEVVVSWLEHEQLVQVDIRGSLRVDPLATQNTSLIALRSRGSAEARWVSGVVLTSTGRALDPLVSGPLKIQYSPELKRMAQVGEQRRAAEARAASAAVDDLVAQASSAILSLVDGEPELPSAPEGQ